MLQSPLTIHLALNKIHGFGPKHILLIERHLGNLSCLPELSANELRSIGWTEQQITAWHHTAWDKIEQEIRRAEKLNCAILHWHDPYYPRLLKEIANPPSILYVRGKKEILNQRCLAIVGTRHPTIQGQKNAEYFSRQLAELGFCIVSGLAMGIDGIAHQNALAYGTIGVVATGLDQTYPVRHTKLAEQMVEHGAVISEFPFNTPPKAEHFPRRNRIISGLSLGIIIIEAALKSGSLITARYAAEQNREVFAIPGSIHNKFSQGCHELIRQGAKLTEHVNHVLEEFGITASYEEKPSSQLTTPLEKPLMDLLTLISEYPISMDELIERTGLSVHILSQYLLELELSKLIQAEENGYSRVF